jgi:hypothetical protein
VSVAGHSGQLDLSLRTAIYNTLPSAHAPPQQPPARQPNCADINTTRSAEIRAATSRSHTASTRRSEPRPPNFTSFGMCATGEPQYMIAITQKAKITCFAHLTGHAVQPWVGNDQFIRLRTFRMALYRAGRYGHFMHNLLSHFSITVAVLWAEVHDCRRSRSGRSGVLRSFNMRLE